MCLFSFFFVMVYDVYFTHCVTQHYHKHLQYPKLLLKYCGKKRFVHSRCVSIHFIYVVLIHTTRILCKKKSCTHTSNKLSSCSAHAMKIYFVGIILHFFSVHTIFSLAQNKKKLKWLMGFTLARTIQCQHENTFIIIK